MQEDLLKKLIGIFSGQNVKISYSNQAYNVVEGICRDVTVIPGETDYFSIYVENGNRIIRSPVVVNPSRVEGEALTYIGGKMTIEVITA